MWPGLWRLPHSRITLVVRQQPAGGHARRHAPVRPRRSAARAAARSRAPWTGYLNHLAAVAGLAPTTCANHGLYLRHFLSWWAKARPGADPVEAVPADLAAFLIHEADRGIAAAARSTQAAMLRRFYAWLVLTGRCTATPAVALRHAPAPLHGTRRSTGPRRSRARRSCRAHRAAG